MSEDWWASTNEEVFSTGPYKSRDEAVADFPVGHALEPGEVFWVGVASEPDTSLDADVILEQTAERAYEEAGEGAEAWASIPGPWPGASKEQAAELDTEINAVFDKWLSKHSLGPSFFVIRNAERIEVQA